MKIGRNSIDLKSKIDSIKKLHENLYPTNLNDFKIPLKRIKVMKNNKRNSSGSQSKSISGTELFKEDIFNRLNSSKY